MPDHKDPQDFAWALHTSSNYEEAADKLDCAVGTITVWKNKHGDKLDEYDESDFTEKKPDPDEVGGGHIESMIRDLLDVEKSGNNLRNTDFGFIVNTEGSISEVAGKNLNPFVAISEHKLNDEWVERCNKNNVGLIVVSEDSVEVLLDSDVTEGSGMRAILTPDAATTFDKYRSTAWLERSIEEGYSVVDIANECSIMPRSVRETMDEFGLNPA